MSHYKEKQIVIQGNKMKRCFMSNQVTYMDSEKQFYIT